MTKLLKLKPLPLKYESILQKCIHVGIGIYSVVTERLQNNYTYLFYINNLKVQILSTSIIQKLVCNIY